MRLVFRSNNTFSRFSTKAVAEAVKTATTVLGSSALGPVTGALVGTLSRDLVNALLDQASAVEKKLDYLLREPLLSGLALLRDGLVHDNETPEQRRARDNLLDNAHVMLMRAWAIVSDSREDALFVVALDCVALTAHGSHQSLAGEKLTKMHVELEDVRMRVQGLVSQAAELLHDSNKIDAWLEHDSLMDQPSGPIQRLWGRSVRKRAAELQDQAERARRHLTILEGLVLFADELLNRQRMIMMPL